MYFYTTPHPSRTELGAWPDVPNGYTVVVDMWQYSMITDHLQVNLAAYVLQPRVALGTSLGCSVMLIGQTWGGDEIIPQVH